MIYTINMKKYTGECIGTEWPVAGKKENTPLFRPEDREKADRAGVP